MRKLIYVSGAIAIVALAAVAYSESQESDTFHRKNQQVSNQGRMLQRDDVPHQHVVQIDAGHEIFPGSVSLAQVDSEEPLFEVAKDDITFFDIGFEVAKDDITFYDFGADTPPKKSSAPIPDLQQMLKQNMLAIKNLKLRQERAAQSNEEINKRINSLLTRAFPRTSLAEAPFDSSHSAQQRRAWIESARSRAALRSGKHSDTASDSEAEIHREMEVDVHWLVGSNRSRAKQVETMQHELNQMYLQLHAEERRGKKLGEAFQQLEKIGIEDMAQQALQMATEHEAETQKLRKRIEHLQKKRQQLEIDQRNSARKNILNAMVDLPGKQSQKSSHSVLKDVLHEIRALRGEVKSLRKEVRKVHDAVLKTKKSAAILVPEAPKDHPFGGRPAKPRSVLSPSVPVYTFEPSTKPRKPIAPRKPDRPKKKPAATPQPELSDPVLTKPENSVPQESTKPAKTSPKKATTDPFGQEESSEQLDPFGSDAPSKNTPSKTTSTKTEPISKDKSSKPLADSAAKKPVKN